MSRLPVAAFVALVIATVGAFFVTQHLKVTTPLLDGHPSPHPAAFNPVNGKTCLLRNHYGVRVPTSFTRTQISFYLLHRADDVDVYVVDQNGTIVDSLASGRHMSINRRHLFTWDGRTSKGAVAPDGKYNFRVSLIRQGRTLLLPDATVTIERRAPALRVTDVRPALIPATGVIGAAATFTGADHHRPRVLIFRTDPPGAPKLVKSFNATTKHGVTAWDGTLTGGGPAPQGTYLVGLRLTDAACNTARLSHPRTSRSGVHQPRRRDRALPRRAAADDPGQRRVTGAGRRRRAPAPVLLGAAPRRGREGPALGLVRVGAAHGPGAGRRAGTVRARAAPGRASNGRSARGERASPRGPARGCWSSCRRSPGRA